MLPASMNRDLDLCFTIYLPKQYTACVDLEFTSKRIVMAEYLEVCCIRFLL